MLPDISGSATVSDSLKNLKSSAESAANNAQKTILGATTQSQSGAYYNFKGTGTILILGAVAVVGLIVYMRLK